MAKSLVSCFFDSRVSTWFIGLTGVHVTNDTMIGSAVFVGLITNERYPWHGARRRLGNDATDTTQQGC